MSNSRTFTITQVILLLAISLLLTGFSGKAWSEEPVSPEYETIPAKPCCAENTKILSGNMFEVNQYGCPPSGPYICFGCFEYTCIGLFSYATMTMDACLLLTFCFLASDCQALCVGLMPESPPFK